MKFRLLLAMVLMTVSVFGQNVPSYVPTNGLVGWWPFNGNANDESGNGNNGTVNGATLTTDRFGNANNAYGFDGIDDYINCGVTNINSSLISINLWLNEFQITSNINVLISKYDGNSYVGDTTISRSFELIRHNNTYQNKFYLSLSDDGINTVGGFSSIQNTVATWSMLTVTYDGTKFTYYWNGQYLNDTIVASIGNIFNSSTPLLIGCFADNGTPYLSGLGQYNGLLDEIGIWNRALTQQEITNLYNAPNPNTSIPIIGCPGAQLPVNVLNGLVGWWPFCGDADDESGNGNNGTVNGATLTSDRFGNVNSAYSFNGFNNWIDVANNPTINFQDEFSISVWVKSNQNNYNAGIIGRWNDFDGAVQDGQEEFALVVDDNVQNMYATIRTNTSPSANLYYQYNNSGYNNNQWNLFIFSFSNNIISLYKNGVFIGNALTSGTINNYIQNLEIGRYAGGQPTGGNTHFNGVLDDIGIWNRALDSSEVVELYNTGLCTQTIAGSCDTLIFNANLTGFNPVTYANQVKVYPNPASDNLVIDCGTNYAGLNGYSIRITNLLGQTVYNNPVTAQVTNIQLNPPTWVNGTYVVQFVHPNGTVMDTKRIIIQ